MNSQPIRLAAGFTLVELLVLLSAAMLLIVVSMAPVASVSDTQRAAQTIARIHNLIGITYQYRRIEGEWPRSDGECAVIGVEGGLDFAGFSIASREGDALTPWGEVLSSDCELVSGNYRLYYDVPNDYVSMFEGRLESTVTEGTGSLDDWTLMVTTLNRFGNQPFKPEYRLSDEVGSGTRAGNADLSKVCDSGEEERLMLAPTAFCGAYENTREYETSGYRIETESRSTNWRFKLRRIYHWQESRVVGEETVIDDFWDRDRAATNCSDQPVNVVAWVQCI